MNKIVGIQFKRNGKVYDFDSGHFVLKKGDKVLMYQEKAGRHFGTKVEETIIER